MNWKKTIDLIGWPRIIIGFFLLSTYCIAPFVGIPLFVAFRDTFTRFGMNAILVLSLMPMIEAGAGLNFGMPLGIEAGLLGALISIQLGLEGVLGFFAAIFFAIPFAILFGWFYGFILNRVKGGEMMIATYIGFSMVSLDRKSTRLNSSHANISYAVFCLKKKHTTSFRIQRSQ